MSKGRTFIAAHHDVKNGLFSHSKYVADRFRLRITCSANVRTCRNKTTQRRFFIHNLHIGTRINRGWNTLGEFNQISRAADAGERALPGKLIVDCQQITRLHLIIQFPHRVEDFFIRRLVEILSCQQLQPKHQSFTVLNHTAQDTSFRLCIIGGNPQCRIIHCHHSVCLNARLCSGLQFYVNFHLSTDARVKLYN